MAPMATNTDSAEPADRPDLRARQIEQVVFAGFPPTAFDFYTGLSQDNSKDFWNAHQQQYRHSVRAPMLALLAYLENDFGSGRLFRPNRDIRFTSDKRPYKDHQGAFVQTSTNCGFYVQIDADGMLIGGGWYSGAPQQVARYREAVAGTAGAALATLCADLSAAGYRIGGERLRSRPRGVPSNHPHIELLRHRTLTVHQEFPSDTPWISTWAVAEHVRRIWTEVDPLLKWLGTHATDPESSQS